jgi:hypothetical protein
MSKAPARNRRWRRRSTETFASIDAILWKESEERHDAREQALEVGRPDRELAP